MEKKKRTTTDLAQAAKNRDKAKYVLKLYVAGITRRSSAAIRSLTEICDEYLKGRYSLEVIDVYKNPTLAAGEQIIAAPTLIKELPSPLRRLIGDMAEKDKVLLGLNLKRIDKSEDIGKKTKKVMPGSEEESGQL